MRAKMIGDAGRTVGFRAGMASRAHTLMKSLDARTLELDALYQFSTLVRPDGTIPPVIVEASDVASFSSEQFRVAGHVYRIEKEERFVSVPPTWRNYLFAGLSGKAQIERRLPKAARRAAANCSSGDTPFVLLGRVARRKPMRWLAPISTG